MRGGGVDSGIRPRRGPAASAVTCALPALLLSPARPPAGPPHGAAAPGRFLPGPVLPVERPPQARHAHRAAVCGRAVPGDRLRGHAAHAGGWRGAWGRAHRALGRRKCGGSGAPASAAPSGEHGCRPCLWCVKPTHLLARPLLPRPLPRSRRATSWARRSLRPQSGWGLRPGTTSLTPASSR